jgi:hypothetical protein
VLEAIGAVALKILPTAVKTAATQTWRRLHPSDWASRLSERSTANTQHRWASRRLQTWLREPGVRQRLESGDAQSELAAQLKDVVGQSPFRWMRPDRYSESAIATVANAGRTPRDWST